MKLKSLFVSALAVTTLAMMCCITANASNGADVWDGTSSDTTWYNEDDTEFTISTGAQLAGLAQLVNSGTSFSKKTVKLGNDIDLDSKPWTPIGKDGSNFQGTFDGFEHKISGLYINKSGTSYVGLFGFTTAGYVKNFTLEDVDVTGYLGVGAVAGCPYTSKYENISVTGSIKVSGYAYVGGALGRNAYANITDVDVISTEEGSLVKAESADYRTYVGGLVGFMGEGNITVKDCDVKIDVTGSTCDIGGISGNLHYANKFDSCNFEGALSLTAADPENIKEIGAICGVVLTTASSETSITNCTATITSATVTAKGESEATEILATITPYGIYYSSKYESAGIFRGDATINGQQVSFGNSANATGRFESGVLGDETGVIRFYGNLENDSNLNIEMIGIYILPMTAFDSSSDYAADTSVTTQDSAVISQINGGAEFCADLMNIKNTYFDSKVGAYVFYKLKDGKNVQLIPIVNNAVVDTEYKLEAGNYEEFISLEAE